MKEIKYKVVWVILFSCTLLLNSCKDSILAEDMEGSWVTSIVTSYDDGTKGHRNEQLTYPFSATKIIHRSMSLYRKPSTCFVSD